MAVFLYEVELCFGKEQSLVLVKWLAISKTVGPLADSLGYVNLCLELQGCVWAEWIVSSLRAALDLSFLCVHMTENRVRNIIGRPWCPYADTGVNEEMIERTMLGLGCLSRENGYDLHCCSVHFFCVLSGYSTPAGQVTAFFPLPLGKSLRNKTNRKHIKINLDAYWKQDSHSEALPVWLQWTLLACLVKYWIFN